MPIMNLALAFNMYVLSGRFYVYVQAPTRARVKPIRVCVRAIRVGVRAIKVRVRAIRVGAMDCSSPSPTQVAISPSLVHLHGHFN